MTERTWSMFFRGLVKADRKPKKLRQTEPAKKTRITRRTPLLAPRKQDRPRWDSNPRITDLHSVRKFHYELKNQGLMKAALLSWRIAWRFYLKI